MKYVPFTKAKPLNTTPAHGYIGYNCYKPGPQAGRYGDALEDVAKVADVATQGMATRDTFTGYLAMLDSPEVLALPEMPPSPYRVAPCGAWDARGLHATAWAAWWGALERWRAHKPRA